MAEQVPENPHTAFVSWMFTESGPYHGIFAQMFRLYSRVMARAEDFEVTFTFTRGEWHIKVAPKSIVGRFAIQSMKTACIKGELSEAQQHAN